MKQNFCGAETDRWFRSLVSGPVGIWAASHLGRFIAGRDPCVPAQCAGIFSLGSLALKENGCKTDGLSDSLEWKTSLRQNAELGVSSVGSAWVVLLSGAELVTAGVETIGA